MISFGVELASREVTCEGVDCVWAVKMPDASNAAQRPDSGLKIGLELPVQFSFCMAYYTGCYIKTKLDELLFVYHIF